MRALHPAYQWRYTGEEASKAVIDSTVKTAHADLSMNREMFSLWASLIVLLSLWLFLNLVELMQIFHQEN